MMSHLFKRAAVEPCVYFKSFSDAFIVFLLYANDMLIIRRDIDMIFKLKDDLPRSFNMKELGLAKQILSINLI